MIGFTPFDIPFMAGDEATPGTTVFVFEFGAQFVIGSRPGAYLLENMAAQRDSGLAGIAIAGGSIFPANQGVIEVGPLTESTGSLSFSFGQYFGFFRYVLATNQAGFLIEMSGLCEVQPAVLGQESTAQSIELFSDARTNSYSHSRDVIGFGLGFRPILSASLDSSGGVYKTLFFYANGQDPAALVHYSAGGLYLEREGIDQQENPTVTLTNSGLCQASIDILGRDNRASFDVVSPGGTYEPAITTEFGREVAATVVSGSGQYTGGERVTENFITRVTDDGEIRFVE